MSCTGLQKKNIAAPGDVNENARSQWASATLVFITAVAIMAAGPAMSGATISHATCWASLCATARAATSTCRTAMVAMALANIARATIADIDAPLAVDTNFFAFIKQHKSQSIAIMALSNTYFYVTVGVLFLIALGAVTLGSITVREQNKAGGAPSNAAIGMTLIGSAALLASIVLFVAYVAQTYRKGNWLSKFVANVRGVPKEFSRKKRALQQRFTDRAIEKMMRTAELRVKADETLGKTRASEKQRVLAALKKAYEASPNKTPEAIAAEIDAQPDITDEMAMQAKQVLGAVEQAADATAAQQVEQEQQKAVQATSGGKKVTLPPPPPIDCAMTPMELSPWVVMS